jgi:hypothetical protein
MSGQTGNLTSQQIIDLLNSDFEFGVNFIIDNNPSAVESNISGLSIPLPQNPSALMMREVVDTLLQDGTNENAVEQFTEILSVPYLDTATNYTGGFSNYIASKMPPAPANASVTLAVISAIGGLVSVAGNIWSGYKQEDLLEIQQQMQQDQIEFELEKIERTKILGIPQSVFIAVIVFVMFTVLIVFLSNRK